MKIKLLVFERIVCLGILPREGSYYNLKNIREVRESLSLSDKEAAIFKPLIISESNGAINANWYEINKIIPEKEIELSDWLFDEIKGSLKKDSDNEKMTDDKVTLYEKFVRGTEHDKQHESDK